MHLARSDSYEVNYDIPCFETKPKDQDILLAGGLRSLSRDQKPSARFIGSDTIRAAGHVGR